MGDLTSDTRELCSHVSDIDCGSWCIRSVPAGTPSNVDMLASGRYEQYFATDVKKLQIPDGILPARAGDISLACSLRSKLDLHDVKTGVCVWNRRQTASTLEYECTCMLCKQGCQSYHCIYHENEPFESTACGLMGHLWSDGSISQSTIWGCEISVATHQNTLHFTVYNLYLQKMAKLSTIIYEKEVLLRLYSPQVVVARMICCALVWTIAVRSRSPVKYSTKSAWWKRASRQI